MSIWLKVFGEKKEEKKDLSKSFEPAVFLLKGKQSVILLRWQNLLS